MSTEEGPDGVPFGEPVDEEWLQHVDALPHDVVLVPEAIKGDVGVYRDEHIAFAKTLRAEDIDAGFCHDAEHRTFSGRKGDPVVIPLVIGIAANVTTGVATVAVKRYLDRCNPKASLRLTVVRRRRDGVASSKDVFKATGPPAEVAQLYEQFEASS
jgi:hypothetical protein